MADLQFINALYFRPTKEEKWNDSLMMVYKDANGNKKFQMIDTPEFDYYINKDEHWTTQQVTFIQPEHVEKITTKYKDLLLNMSKQLGQESVNFYKECMANGKRYYANRLHLNANVHSSDVDITDFYIAKFIDKHPDTGRKLSKAFFDIEVDIIDYDGFPDEHDAPVPINIVTIRYASTNTSYTYILRNPDNPQSEDFEANKDEEISMIHQYIKDKENLDSKFDFKFFDSEIDLIAAFFDDLNELKPDYAGAWNMKFDILTFINRIKNLGYDPEDIICPQEMPKKVVYYKEDVRNQDVADKNDFFQVASYTNFQDLMLLFANLRKTMGKRDSYSLDAISREELGKTKLEFDTNENIKNVAYVNYRKFVLYNIIDVIRLEQIEDKNDDISMLHSVATMTRTRINKAMAKTVSLKNLARKFYSDQGFIMSNNHNATYGGDRVEIGKFRGAFVASPVLNANMGVMINGKRSKSLYENVIDMDLSSLYPSIILALNIDTSTQYGKVEIAGVDSLGQYEDKSPEYCDSLISKDYLSFGTKWMGLPTPEQVIREFAATVK